MLDTQLLPQLRHRNLIFQTSDDAGISDLLNQPTVVYCGFDPTADSLHIGNLLPLLALRRFQLAGHKVIAVLGGGTGLIGDPSGKASERSLNEKETVDNWVARIRSQVGSVLDLDGNNPAVVVDNYNWIGSLRTIDFLRDLGKHFSVSTMLSRDSVKSRLESGLSYTEFSYMVLQANDFLQLHRDYHCTLQIGGSDQWGNMVAGIDLIRRTTGAEAYALTFPLITTSDGKKFGKSEGGAIWLDPARTSPYHFYQYWLNVDDRDVIRFLGFFTLLSDSELNQLATSVQTSPEKRAAQARLAQEVTALVHGELQAANAKRATEVFFHEGNVQDLDAMTLENALSNVPKVIWKQPGDSLSALFVSSGLAKSKGEVRRLASSGGLYVNGALIDDVDAVPDESKFLHGRFLVLRRGKKTYALVDKDVQ